MKKKILLTLFVALFGVMAFTSLNASAASIEDLNLIPFEDGWMISRPLEPIEGELVIPETVDGMPVVAIDHGAFSEMSLTSITIPDSVTFIGDGAFSNTSITSITIPDSVTYLGYGAFTVCTDLLSATIGNGVEVLYAELFLGCENLKYVGLSATVDSIEMQAFEYCNNLELVFYEAGKSQWDKIYIDPSVYMPHPGVVTDPANAPIINAPKIYNSPKRTYTFVTNCETALPDLNTFAIYPAPAITNDGKLLEGWYDNEDFEGEPVSFPYSGDATTLYANWANETGASFEDSLTIKTNREYSITTTSEEQIVYFKFEPTQSKEYSFCSVGGTDTMGYLYDSNGKQLRYNNNSGDMDNFYISYDMTAGETYYIAVKLAIGTGTYTLTAKTETTDVYSTNSITIKDISGNELNYIPQDSFVATISFTNICSAEDSVVVLVLYTAEGAFKGLMYTSAEDVPEGSTIRISLPVDNSNGDIATLKAFCIDSFGSFVPLGKAATYTAQ